MRRYWSKIRSRLVLSLGVLWLAVVFPALAAPSAPRAEQRPMQLEWLRGRRRRRLHVETIDVLRHENEIRAEILHRGKGDVARVRGRPRDELAPPRVPVPDEPGIAFERLRGR